MNSSELPARRPRRAVLSRGAVLAFAGIIAGSAIIAGPALEPARALMDLASGTFTSAQSLRILGRDGRFTILLLGSDARPSFPGLRTDAILVASVDPVTGRAAIFSIPRDTVNFPLSATRKYPGKINALYQYLGRTNRNPGTAMRKIVGNALGVEIDAYALLGFAGFRKLVNNIGGVDVYLTRALTDPKYTILVDGVRRRITFRQGWNHLEDLRALAYARIRYVDNDYARSRRQQQVIVAAIQKVLTRGPERLAGLIAASAGLIKTDLPLADAPLVYAMVSRANLATAPRTVFGPRTYATALPLSRIVLRLTICRAWIRRYFPPVHPGAAWLPPEPTPTPAPVP